MRALALALCAGCGNSVIAVQDSDLGANDLAKLPLADLAEAADLATDVDLSVEQLEMGPAQDLRLPDLQMPDLQKPDMVACGGPSEACCMGTDCSQSGAMSVGWFGSKCSGGSCIQCGKPGQPCCVGDACVRSAQLNAICYTDTITGRTCEECGQGGQPVCP